MMDSGLLDDDVQQESVCAFVKDSVVRRFSTSHATVTLDFNSLIAPEDMIKNCPLPTKSTNNTQENPACTVYLTFSFKQVHRKSQEN